jgi:transposase-like protein
MAKREDFTMTTSERKRRTFSKSFKQEKVRKIEMGLLKVSEVCKMYQVSPTAVYKWQSIYGTEKRPERLVMETDSDSKALLAMRAKLAELERLVGQKQIEIEFYKKMVEVAEDHYDIDIKKNFSTPPSGDSGSNENNTASV